MIIGNLKGHIHIKKKIGITIDIYMINDEE